MRIRKAILMGVVLVAVAAGVLRFTGLSRAAASHTPAASADECALFSCIFDDDPDDDD